MHPRNYLFLVILLLGVGCPRPIDASSKIQPNKAEKKVQKVQAQNNTQASPSRPAPLPAPKDLLNPPADAEVATSGLKSRVLTAGKGTQKPGREDVVQVHYTGWG